MQKFQTAKVATASSQVDGERAGERCSHRLIKYLLIFLHTQRMRQKQEEGMLVMMWLRPMVLSAPKGARQSFREQFKAGPGLSQYSNAPLATASRLRDDMHHSSQTLYAHVRIYKLYKAYKYILILWQSQHIYIHIVHTSAGEPQEREREKNRAEKGHFSFTVQKVCVCSHACVCVFVWACLHHLGLNLLALQHVCSLSKQADRQRGQTGCYKTQPGEKKAKKKTGEGLSICYAYSTCISCIISARTCQFGLCWFDARSYILHLFCSYRIASKRQNTTWRQTVIFPFNMCVHVWCASERACECECLQHFGLN